MASEMNMGSDALRQRLEKLEREGTKLYFNGAPSSTEYIIDHCINEDSAYMPDYVTDEHGKIKEIRYDKISLK